MWFHSLSHLISLRNRGWFNNFQSRTSLNNPQDNCRLERSDQRPRYRLWFIVSHNRYSLAVDIDGSFKINKGLRIARQLLCDINHMGVPVGVELLDTISPQYISVSAPLSPVIFDQLYTRIYSVGGQLVWFFPQAAFFLLTPCRCTNHGITTSPWTR